MIDNKTSRLLLPLPNVDNYLEEDVARLQEALTMLDGAVATVNGAGTLAEEQIPDDVARLGDDGFLLPDQMPANYASLDEDGKLKAEQMPDNVARSGVNSDITKLTALSGGPLQLGGDGVSDFDAVTMRQARNMGGGTGPTQSGVMNFAIGSTRLHTSRAFIFPYEVTADGQLLKRADWPDLWAYAQLVGVITDSVWRGDVGQRAKYSDGDGSTTFRVPDLNGVQKSGVNGFVGPDSLIGLFGRGDGGAASAGRISDSEAPNIKGSLEFRPSSNSGTGGALTAASGSFTGNATGQGGGPWAVVTTGGTARAADTATFNASASSLVYKDGATEAKPRNFIGVWVIRASGAFTAANTSFGVMNSYASLPSAGTVLEGGRAQSEIRVAGALHSKVALVVKARVGGTVQGAFDITDSSGPTSTVRTLTLPEGDGTLVKLGDYGIGTPVAIVPSGNPVNANNATHNGFYTGAGAGGVNFISEYMPMLVMSREASGNCSQIQVGVSGSLGSRSRLNNAWTAWRVSWDNANTIVDANGFIKRASPVVKVFGSGDFETNEESEGVTVTRLSEGMYLLDGCLGLNSDCAWGGIDGGFEIPLDRNKQPVIWLDYEVKEDGSVIVKTYHRVNASAPAFARNEIDGKADGDPIDIPSGVFVSVRVQMPE